MVGSSYVGSNVRPGFRWAPFMEKSGENHGMVSIEELIVDPYLPTVALDPYDMARAIIIPSGRFVSVGLNTPAGATRFPWNGQGKTPLTLHDGLHLTPIGFSVNQMYRESTDGLIGSNTVKFRRGFVAELPFVPAINNAHGILNAGDKITGYFGSTVATVAPSFAHRGRPVKWNPNQTFLVTSAASGIINLPAAIYPGIPPKFVYVQDASGNILSTVASSLVWNTGLALWQYVGAAATRILYTWGQSEDQIGGEVVRIQSLDDLLDRSNFLRWVEYMRKDPVTFPPFEPAMQRRPAEGVINEALTFDANNQSRVANYEMDIHHECHLQIQGSITYDDGTTQTYTSWYSMPGALRDIRSGFYGKYHTINWRTGVIQVASNVVISAAQISYYYITDSREAHILWGGGIINLTDGGRVNTLGNRNPAGLPAQLDLPDVTAAMRIIVK